MIGEATDEAMDKMIRTCDELLRISHDQRAAIVEDQADLLEDLLDARQRLISSLDVEAGIFENDPVPPGAVAGKRAVFLKKLGELLRIDEENRKALESRLMEVKSQLASVNRGRDALVGYTSIRQQAEPVFVDRRR